MKPNNYLKKMDFGNEAADDVDDEELKSYFVAQDTFDTFLKDSKRLQVIKAKKGMGKSALIKWLGLEIVEKYEDSLVIKIRGSDLSRDNFKLTSSLSEPNEYIQDWMIRLCAIVNRELAKRIGFAINDDQISLVESAEFQGFKERHLISCLLSRFKNILGKYQPETTQTINQHEVLKRINSLNYSKIWILIDDLDATFQNTNKEKVNIGSFFSACRYMIQDIKGINFRVTLRSDVWPVIRRHDESMDKIEQYVSEISWSEEDFKRIICQRIQAEFPTDTRPLNEDELLEKIFQPTVFWNEKNVPTYQVLYILAYNRPRWGVQLCKLAQEDAIRKSMSHIAKLNIDARWGEYGLKRIADLVVEHKHQCMQVEDLVTSFRGLDRRFPQTELLEIIRKRILNSLIVQIDGQKATKPEEIADFLYRIGFIVARTEEDGYGYHHYNYSDLPDLFSGHRKNGFNLIWEIHPCYREALNIKKLNAEQRNAKNLYK
ncbi:P-loop ATPase, Sll1717 family [Bergeriella denitrificans]|uniref:Uncharacterized protein n=1 Tax=Bergeriella denitrificans TaxID=494 RepID=A0A378UFG7_BERDE|nr:hypothetical protein [Bergeriella denitrificans]STZ75449.1 Uncharacterised protein [Bergeriella denitrificans]